MGTGSPRRATQARHDALVALVRSGVADVDALADRLRVSRSTVRRDLTRLQGAGHIARTYGGALIRDTFEERSFNESSRINQRAKEAIADHAVLRLAPGATVFLDAGTTCLALARVLAGRGPLTVVTRGLEAAVQLARAPDVDVVMLGGAVRPLSHGVVGPLASLAFERLTFDVAFLGADAVDPVKGLGEPTVDETFVKEQAAARAGEVLVLADASKTTPVNLPAWLPLGRNWTLVTDRGVGDDVVAAFTQQEIRVSVAG